MWIDTNISMIFPHSLGKGVAESDTVKDEEIVSLDVIKSAYDHLVSTTDIEDSFGTDLGKFFRAWERMDKGEKRWEKYATLVNLGASIPSFSPLLVTIFGAYGLPIEPLYYAASGTIGPIATIFIVEVGRRLRRQVEQDRATVKRNRPFVESILELYRRNKNPTPDEKDCCWDKRLGRIMNGRWVRTK